MNEIRPRAPQQGRGHPTFWTPLFLAWLLALLATAGALFLGEVMGNTPCVLCWYQRIAMFPLVLVIGMGLFHLGLAVRATPCHWPGWDGASLPTT